MSQVPSTATPSTDFETIFRAASEAYKKQTKKDITSHPLATQLQPCDSSSAILAVLRSQVQTYDQSQSADERWTKWLDPTVNVLYAFSATLGNSVGLMFPLANAVFAGIGVLLQAIKDVRASQDAIGDIFVRMEYFFKRLEAYIKVRPTAAMMEIIVKIMVEVLSILGIVTKEIGEGKMKKYFKKLVGRQDVEGALQRLDKLTQEEARMAAVENLVITRGIDEKVEGVGHKVGSVIQGVKETGVAIQQVVNQVSHLNRNELRKDLRNWVAPPDPSVNYNVASGAHHEGTAAWCTKGNAVTIWKTSGSLLWIHGKLGSGKSILSSVIIQDIKSMSKAGSAFLAYFYFDFKDTAKQDSRALLSSLLVQLSDQSDVFCDTLFSLYSAHKQGSEQPTVGSLTRCLEDMLTAMRQVPIYLVMDALDECPNDSGIPSLRENVLELVEELVGLHHPNLRLCVTSRPEFDIRTTLEPLATQQVSLHDECGQKQDINDYITFVVRSDRRMKKWRDDDKDAVIENLTEKADGMFRWVFCQLEVLRHCFPTNLRRVLQELPKSLDETYKRILKDINNANREHAYRLLQCLAVASRPLRVEELAEVLTFDLSTGGIPKLIPDWRWEDREEAVLSACSSLVAVIIDDGSRVVQFSHFSVKEFLTSDRLANCMEEVSRFHLPIEPSHVILAQACLGVLLRLDDRTDEDSAKNIPLFRYAAEHWDGHAQVGNVELEIKDAMDCFFDMAKPHFSAWVRIQKPYDLMVDYKYEQPRTVPLSAAPLYLAAMKGFRALLERLICKHPEQVNHLGSRFGTPLHASVEMGDIKVVQLLFSRGADINSRCADNRTPLHIASAMGFFEIGKWLLNCGADPNSQDRRGVTPLYDASVSGSYAVVRLLLDNHVDADVRDKHGYTPLRWAATYGHVEVARILLERNAGVNTRSNKGNTPLLKASKGGYPDVVQLLLDHNADVYVRDHKGNTPLHCAALGHPEAKELEHKYTDIVQLLLDHNADVFVRNSHGDTPLHCAAFGGRLEVTRILLELNAEVNAQNFQGDTPLHTAVTRDHVEVARILLELDAEANSLNDEGSTPLHLASERGYTDVVQLLLDHNSDAFVRNGHGDTPLHRAASGGRLEVARILLELNAEVNSLNGKGSTPLHLASERGYTDVVQLLLDHNADVFARNGDGDTPLHRSALSFRPEVARILLELNAEVNSLNGKGSTPLHLASERGYADVVQLLIDHNADVFVRNGDGDTPLHHAAVGGELEVVRILLELNAEVNSLNGKGSTPLHRVSEDGCHCGSQWLGGNPGVVRLLLDFGADVQVRNLSGKTASEVARGPRRQEIVQLLSQRAAE